MISTSGSRLMKEDAVQVLLRKLLPLADIITPNIPEAEVLSGISIITQCDMELAAKKIGESYSGNILIKGGHLKDKSDDLLYTGGKIHWFLQENIDNPNTHGTGCTLSSAIACNIAEGKSILDSISAAKEYISGALLDELDLGLGSGPLNHCWNLK
jgi:hydroxymethylpyrimidine/phosphomethylpyrimidine kinase